MTGSFGDRRPSPSSAEGANGLAVPHVGFIADAAARDDGGTPRSIVELARLLRREPVAFAQNVEPASSALWQPNAPPGAAAFTLPSSAGAASAFFHFAWESSMTVRYQGRRTANSAWIVVRLDDSTGIETELPDLRYASLAREVPICWGPGASVLARAGLAMALVGDAMLPWHRGNNFADELMTAAASFGDEWEVTRDEIRRELTKRSLRSAIALAKEQGVSPEDL